MFMQLWNPWYHAVLCWGNPAWCNTKRAMLSRSNLAMWVFAKWQHELTIIVGLIQNAGVDMKPARVKQCLSNQPWLGLVSLSHLQKWWPGDGLLFYRSSRCSEVGVFKWSGRGTVRSQNGEKIYDNMMVEYNTCTTLYSILKQQWWLENMMFCFGGSIWLA